ncbi:hypothetical protein BD769DRAFT_594257 [Suillus cothurnatus]|nr:hypothetical protein BD769DRAFT_594257 [Suillus cothurnatus]
MATSNQALFLQLNLGKSNSKDEPLRRSLGCSPDEVQVGSGGALEKNQFIARLRIRKFQKRLLIAEDVGIEFVAVGRIWLFRSFMTRNGKWCITLSLVGPSLPARPVGTVSIKAHIRPPGSEAPPSLVLQYPMCGVPGILVPDGYGLKLKGDNKANYVSMDWLMTDWPMDKETKYVDCDGTLHVKIKMTLD